MKSFDSQPTDRDHCFENVHQKLQAASVALDQLRLDTARTLARQVLEVHPGQPQAVYVIEEAARWAPRLEPTIQRSIGGAFFLQKMKVCSVDDRMEIIAPLVRGKRVLHVGCTDHPVLDLANNLHAKLAPIASELDGLDVDAEGLRLLEQHIAGRYFATVDAVRDCGIRYDVLLVPETIEHVINAGDFLRDLDRLEFERWMLSAPCVYGGFKHPTVSIRSGSETVGPYAEIMHDDCVVEEVHPDHKYWFTPYTLANLLQSSVPWSIDEAWLMHERRQVGLVGHHKVDVLNQS